MPTADGNNGQRQPEKDRDAEAVKQSRHHVAPLIVGAEPVHIAPVAVRIGRLLVVGRAAIRRRHHPRWRRRGRRGQVLVFRVVGIADRWKQHPAMRIDLVAVGRIAEIGGGEEAAELRFRIVDDNRKQPLALVGDYDRPVRGDDFRKEADREQQQEQPERPPAAPIAAKIPEAALIERGQPHQTSRLSKSMRGSTQV